MLAGELMLCTRSITSALERPAGGTLEGARSDTRASKIPAPGRRIIDVRAVPHHPTGKRHMSELAVAAMIATFMLTAWYALRPRA